MISLLLICLLTWSVSVTYLRNNDSNKNKSIETEFIQVFRHTKCHSFVGCRVFEQNWIFQNWSMTFTIPRMLSVSISLYTIVKMSLGLALTDRLDVYNVVNMVIIIEVDKHNNVVQPISSNAILSNFSLSNVRFCLNPICWMTCLVFQSPILGRIPGLFLRFLTDIFHLWLTRDRDEGRRSWRFISFSDLQVTAQQHPPLKNVKLPPRRRG